MTPFESAAARLPSIRRKKPGDGMMTSTEVLEFRDPYSRSVQQLRPGRDRVSFDHWTYKKQFQYFMPVNRDDTATVARHRETLERARRLVERKLGRTGTTRTTRFSRPKRFQLSAPPRGRWRLP